MHTSGQLSNGMNYRNGIAEDLGAILGYSAATRLMALYGGQKIYIPNQCDGAHRLALLLGESAMSGLCAEFGGQLLKVPSHEEYKRMQRIRVVADLIQAGWRVSDIAESMEFSARQVRNYRTQAEQFGLLPLVFHGAGQASAG